MRHLGGAVHREKIGVGVVDREGAARFHRHARVTADANRQLHDAISAREGRVEVAVAFADHCRLAEQFRRRFRKYGNGLGERIEMRVQFLDVAEHRVGRVLGKIGVGGEHGRNGIADIAHVVARQRPLSIRREALDARHAEVDLRQIGDVFGRPDGDDALYAARGLRVDAENAAERDRRAHDPHVQLTRGGLIGDESAFSAQQRQVLDATRGLPDHGGVR